MSDFGQKFQDSRMGLKPHLQNSRCSWAKTLQDNTLKKKHDIENLLFDDVQYGIEFFCNPKSILQQLLSFDRAEKIQFKMFKMIEETIYADDEDLANLVDITQTPAVFTRFIDMCLSIAIQTNFPKSLNEQDKWVYKAVTSYSMDSLNDALQIAHTKLVLIMEWLAYSQDISVDDWKVENDRLPYYSLQFDIPNAFLTNNTNIFAHTSWLYHFKPKQTLPVRINKQIPHRNFQHFFQGGLHDANTRLKQLVKLLFRPLAIAGISIT